MDKYSHLVLFDIDGTLVHCGPTPRRVFKQALIAVFGTAGPIDGWIFDGKTDPMIVEELMAASGISADRNMIFKALDIYARAVKSELPSEKKKKIYPGVRELLRALSKQPVLIGLLTGNIKNGARAKLESLGLWNHFALGAFADDSPVRKELADIAVRRAKEFSGQEFSGKQIVIIGDTEHDMACGQHLGAKAIGVGTARSTTKELMVHGADHAFDDLSETQKVMDAILK